MEQVLELCQYLTPFIFDLIKLLIFGIVLIHDLIDNHLHQILVGNKTFNGLTGLKVLHLDSNLFSRLVWNTGSNFFHFLFYQSLNECCKAKFDNKVHMFKWFIDAAGDEIKSLYSSN